MQNTGAQTHQLLNEVIHTVWTSAKRWRTIWLGPISLKFRMARTIHVSNNTARHLNNKIRKFFSLTSTADLRMTPQAIPAQGPEPEQDGVSERETALIIGAGPGLGFALARKLAASGMNLALACRSAERLDALVASLQPAKDQVICAYGCDATDDASVKGLMSLVSRNVSIPHLVVYAVQGFAPGKAIDTETSVFEECWRQNCLGAFIVSREAARSMLQRQRGTLVLIGSTSGVIGRAAHLNLAVGKFGLRALSQVLARELWPRGIHVVHVVIDADIREENSVHIHDQQALPEDISELIYGLHRQPRSSWTSEVDVRPWNINFWEHC